MLDQIEESIARELADHYLYPFARNIYQDIFRSFSHFPLNLKDIDMNGPGTTITYLALVVKMCLQNKNNDFNELFENVQNLLYSKVKPLLIQEPKVETFLGCILYAYHPSQIKNAFSSIRVENIFTEKEIYEYHLKRKTILIYAL